MGSSSGQGSRIPLESNDAIVSRLAEQDNVPWYNKPNLRLLYFLMAPTCLGVEMTSGFDASMMNALQAVPSWLEYFHHPHSASLGLMISMYALGSIASLPFIPFAVDKLGRRYPILLGATTSIVGGILQGAALNPVMFALARFILGFSNILCVVAASSLIGELSHPKERAVMGCLFTTSFDIGAVAAAAVALRTFTMTSNWGWRIPSLLQVVPSLLQVTFIWFLPESPRWLIANGRGDEARTILVKYHAEGNENLEFVKAEYSQIQETLEAEMKVAQMNRKEVFSTPAMRKRAMIAAFIGLAAQWSGGGLISHLLSPILDGIGIHDNRTKNIVNLSKSFWSLVSGIFIAFIVPWYPRRAIFLISAISTFVVFTAWTLASADYSSTHNKTSAHLVLVLIFLHSPAHNLAFSALIHTYLVELFPFHARAKGITVYQWLYRSAAFLGQLVNPIGIDSMGWRWYIVYCIWDAFQVVVVYLIFPETSGRTLEELTFLHEGDDRDLEFDPLLEREETDTDEI